MKLSAKKLTMQFNDAGRTIEVFHDLDLEVPSGSSVAIVGESGVGKTTLLYVLGGLERPVAGDVVLGDSFSYNTYVGQGRDLAGLRRKYLGFVFQMHYLLPEFDALENVSMPLLIQGVDLAEARERANNLLGRVGLSHRLSHRPGALSGGEQQRVAIARAVAGKPGVVLADEPTGNLDHRTGSEVSKLLKQLQKEEGITLLVVTHSLDFARTMDRIVELTPQGLFER